MHGNDISLCSGFIERIICKHLRSKQRSYSTTYYYWSYYAVIYLQKKKLPHTLRWDSFLSSEVCWCWIGKNGSWWTACLCVFSVFVWKWENDCWLSGLPSQVTSVPSSTSALGTGQRPGLLHPASSSWRWLEYPPEATTGDFRSRQIRKMGPGQVSVDSDSQKNHLIFWGCQVQVQFLPKWTAGKKEGELGST